MKHRIVYFLAAALVYASACNKHQQPQDTAAVHQSVSNQQFIFRAETANPLGGGTIRLNDTYDVLIAPKEVNAYLPYFGRAYAGAPPFGGPVEVLSRDFEYEAQRTQRGGWEILIRPRDAHQVQEMRLIIAADGYATLHVTSTNRQAISYYGRIINNR